MNDLVDRLAVEAAQKQAGRSGHRHPADLGPADVVGTPRATIRRVPDGPSAGRDRPATARARWLRRQPVADRRARQARRDPGGQARDARRPRRAHRARARRRAARRRGRRGRRRALRRRAAVSRPRRGVARRRPGPLRASCWPAARDQVLLQARVARTTKQAAGGALARRDAWLARHAHEAVVVWDGDDARTGKQVRSLQDHLGDDVWVLEPGRRRLEHALRRRHRRHVHRRRLRRRTGRQGAVDASTTRAVRSRPRCRRRAPSCSPTARRSPPTRCSSAAAAAVALITNAGFADVIEIARQDRPSLYDIGVDRPVPLVPRSDRLEVRGRLDATGRELEPVDLDAAPAAARRHRSGRGLPPARRPRPRSRAGGRRARAARATTSTSPARATSRRSSASTSARSRRSSTPTCGPRAARTCRRSTRSPTRCS